MATTGADNGADGAKPNTRASPYASTGPPINGSGAAAATERCTVVGATISNVITNSATTRRDTRANRGWSDGSPMEGRRRADDGDLGTRSHCAILAHRPSRREDDTRPSGSVSFSLAGGRTTRVLPRP